MAIQSKKNKPEYTRYSTQTAVSKKETPKQKTTTSIYANLEHSKPNMFAELLSDKSKVKFQIQDYSDGNNKFVYYNMSIPEFEWLYDKVMFGVYKSHYFAPNSLDAYKKPGEDTVDIRLITINYNKEMNYPYSLTIKNGKGNVGKIEKDLSETTVRFTEVEFLGMLRATKRYIEKYVDVIAPTLITKGLIQYEKQEKERTDKHTIQSATKNNRMANEVQNVIPIDRTAEEKKGKTYVNNNRDMFTNDEMARHYADVYAN